MNKKLLTIVQLFRCYDAVISRNLKITFINTLERFAYGQASREELELCFDNLDRELENSCSFKWAVQYSLTNPDMVIRKVMRFLGYLYAVMDKGVEGETVEDRYHWWSRIKEAIDSDTIETLPKIKPTSVTEHNVSTTLFYKGMSPNHVEL